MAIIARSERSEGINPTPLRAGDTGAGLVGDAVQRAGNALNSFAVTMAKEREDLDQFETKMALQKFHNDQTRRQVEYDDGIQGDGREHTAGRIAEYDQARDGLIKTLPKNERSRKMAMLQTENWRGDFGMRSLNAQRGHINTYKETELLNQTVIGVVPGVTGDRATVEPALKKLDTMVNGSGLPEGRRNAIRANAVGLIVERFIEQGDITSRMQADNIIKEYQERLKSEPKPEPTEFDTGTADFSGQGGPASVRFNNPGAMYPGPSSRKFGATHTETIGGGHKIAVFPDAVSGAAAQFDLLSSKYTGQSLEKAIAKWSGGNSVDAYLGRITKATGLERGTVLTKEMMADPRVAIPLAKIMSTHEAGTTYPLSDEQWDKAHQMALAGAAAAAGSDLKFRGSETAQHTNGRGETSDVEIRLGRSDGLFVRGLIHNLDKIDQRVAKLQEQDAAAWQVQQWATGALPFNPHDDESRKKVDKAFENSSLSRKLFEGDPGTVEQAVLVSQSLNYVPERVSDALHGMIKNTANPEIRERGLLAASSILDRRPFAFDATAGAEGVKKDATYFTALVRGQGLTAAKALERIDEFNSPEWGKLESERKKKANEEVDFLTEFDLKGAFNTGWPIFGRPSLQEIGSQSAVLMADFKTAFREHYTRTGDSDLAKKLAVGELSRTWGKSSVTGTGVLTKHPPETRYPALGNSFQWLQDDLLSTVNDWRKAKGEKPVEAADLASRLAVVSDAQTDREAKAKSNTRVSEQMPPPPSYVLLWRNDDGIDHPIASIGPNGKVQNRWRGDFKAAEKVYEEKQATERKGWLEGKTSTNPATGERLIFKGGKWQPNSEDDTSGLMVGAP